MIRLFLRMAAPRLLLAVLLGFMFYLNEPVFHEHEGPVRTLADRPHPIDLAGSAANLAALTMVILLAGFLSTDRRRGYYRLTFTQPISPLRYYGTRWLLCLALSMGAAAVFMVAGQYAAWGEYLGGGQGLLLALVAAVAYGGLLAFLSAVLPFGDTWVALVVFFATFFWLNALTFGAQPFVTPVREAISLLLPPQTALRDVDDGLARGVLDWGAGTFALGYGMLWLAGAGLLVRFREWP
ncbi:MAG: hypothetical protein JWM27_2729 [Gemmatimonadetes bacterium]|nr:hypothetical protein [Gemmatimonadota bacterium]